jgi:hypothetical protein
MDTHPTTATSTTSTTRTDLRRVVLAVTISSFSIAALMGIAALLGADIFSETSVKILATTVTVGCASMLTLCCLVVVGGRFQPVGLLGFLVTLGTTVLALALVWSASESLWNHVDQTFRVAITASLTLAQVCLLLGLAGSRRRLAPLTWSTVALALVVGGMVSALIYDYQPADGYVRGLGVVAILDVLGTLVTIALGVFGRDERNLVVTVPPALAARLRTVAQEEGRPVDEIAGQLLEDALAGPYAEPAG